MGINCFFLVHLQFLRLITLDNLYSTLSRMGRLYQMGLLLFPLMDFFYIYIEKDIRALFPSDCNPFYAGFGNRDTDDFSYLKVGIPKGKIFIINSRGEVAVNCRVDTRLYSTLHALVNGMFPSMSSSDQEDISSWNYWKLLPTVSIYEGVSYNFCLISDGFGVANASSGIKLTWTLITHIFFPDRLCKAP